MRRISLLIVALIFSTFVLQSCKNDSEVKNSAREKLSNPKDKIAQAAANPKDVLNKKEAEPIGPTTTVVFAEPTYDFGKVMDGDIVEHDYIFTNTGTEPLILKNVKASCGCTTPSWPRNAIAPGDQGKIHARFDTKKRGRTGGAPQSKSITVTGNIEGGKTVLKLKGMVDKIEDPNAPKVSKTTNTKTSNTRTLNAVPAKKPN